MTGYSGNINGVIVFHGVPLGTPCEGLGGGGGGGGGGGVGGLVVWGVDFTQRSRSPCISREDRLKGSSLLVPGVEMDLSISTIHVNVGPLETPD